MLLPCSAFAFDLTPKLVTKSAGTITEKYVRFYYAPKVAVQYAYPKDWKVGGGQSLVTFTPPDIANSLFTLSTAPAASSPSQNLRDNPQTLTKFKDAALALIPPGVTVTNVDEPEYGGFPTQAFQVGFNTAVKVQYVQSGLQMTALVVFIELPSDNDQIRLTITAPSTDFPQMASAVQSSFGGWAWYSGNLAEMDTPIIVPDPENPD